MRRIHPLVVLFFGAREDSISVYFEKNQNTLFYPGLRYSGFVIVLWHGAFVSRVPYYFIRDFIYVLKSYANLYPLLSGCCCFSDWYGSDTNFVDIGSLAGRTNLSKNDFLDIIFFFMNVSDVAPANCYSINNFRIQNTVLLYKFYFDFNCFVRGSLLGLIKFDYFSNRYNFVLQFPMRVLFFKFLFSFSSLVFMILSYLFLNRLFFYVAIGFFALLNYVLLSKSSRFFAQALRNYIKISLILMLFPFLYGFTGFLLFFFHFIEVFYNILYDRYYKYCFLS